MSRIIELSVLPGLEQVSQLAITRVCTTSARALCPRQRRIDRLSSLVRWLHAGTTARSRHGKVVLMTHVLKLTMLSVAKADRFRYHLIDHKARP